MPFAHAVRTPNFQFSIFNCAAKVVTTIISLFITFAPVS